MASDPKNISSAIRAKVYTSFAADINLLTDASGGGDACRRIRVISGGVVACYFKDDPTTKVLLEYAAGDVDRQRPELEGPVGHARRRDGVGHQ